MLYGLGKVVLIRSVFRPYRHTTYVDVAYCYSSMLCWSVCHSREPCKKWLGRWRCRLGCGLGWAQGTTL